MEDDDEDVVIVRCSAPPIAAAAGARAAEPNPHLRQRCQRRREETSRQPYVLPEGNIWCFAWAPSKPGMPLRMVPQRKFKPFLFLEQVLSGWVLVGAVIRKLTKNLVKSQVQTSEQTCLSCLNVMHLISYVDNTLKPSAAKDTVYIYCREVAASGFKFKGRLVPALRSARPSTSGMRDLTSFSEADARLLRESNPAFDCLQSRVASEVGRVFTLLELWENYPILESYPAMCKHLRILSNIY